MLAILGLIGLAATGVFVLTESLGNHVSRVPNVFGALDDGARPAERAATTFLLVGSDSRSTDPTTGTDAPAGVEAGSRRSDVIMLAQVDAQRTHASVVSIPRDSWVEIPGRGPDKINAAYAYGGPGLLVQTVESLTGVRVDHFAVIDFAGFRSMVDAVGGIDVRVAAPSHNGPIGFPAGLNHLDGTRALAYVRERYDLPRGDLDRAQRQQNALRALLRTAASGGTLSDPVGLYRLLDATSRSVSVDDALDNGGLRALAFDLRELRPGGVTFLSAPVGGLGREGTQSVVHLDEPRAAGLWAAMRADTMTGYLTQHPGDVLGAAPP